MVTPSLNACRANATLFSVEVNSSVSCIMFWLAFRSGYCSAHGEQSTDGAGQQTLGTGETLDRLGIAGVGRGRFETAGCLVPGRDHGFEGLSLM